MKHLSLRASEGFSLIEMAIIMMLMSLAMVPMVTMISGQSTSLGTGAAAKSGSGTRLIGVKTKEVVFANSLMERALAGDATVFTTQADGAACAGGGALPAPNSGGQAVYNCVDTVTYRDRVYYQWVVQDRANEFPGNTATEDKMKNAFYRATLNVYNNDTWTGTPVMTMPTMTFTNTTPPDEESTLAGVVVVLDISGSMAWAQADGNDKFPGTYYRYASPGYTPPTAGLNLFNNADLDLVLAQPTNDPATLYDDRYPRNTVLGMAKCGSASPGGPADPIFHNIGFGGNLYTGSDRVYIDRLCDGTAPYLHGSDALYNNSLSRLEAARNSLLSFLIDLEADQTLRESIQLGFVTYEGSNITNRLPTAINGQLEKANAAGYYANTRTFFSWINRHGVNSRQILPGSGTPTWQGVKRAADILYAQPNLNERAILLVTDGVPTSGPCSGPSNPTAAQTVAEGICFRDSNTSGVNGLGKALGNGSYPGANGKTIRIYALGIIEDPVLMSNVLDVGLAKPTNGTFKPVTSIGQVKSVFDDIKYQLFKQILLSKADRYGINLN